MIDVLFLDIDGVLNSEDYFYSIPADQLNDIPLDKRCVARVSRIIEATGAVIVLTSSWRGGWDKDPEKIREEGRVLNKIFAEYGMTIYDKTPVSTRGRRPVEIKEWMESCGERVRRYVIIDDYDFDWKKHKMHKHWVQTDYTASGLTDEKAEEAIALFRKSFLYYLTPGTVLL